MESTLVAVDPKGGNVMCSYRGPNGEQATETIKTECKVPAMVKKTNIPQSLVNASAATLATGVSAKMGIETDGDVFETGGLREKLHEVKDDLKGKQSFDVIASQLSPMDSHSEYQKTVPSIITGVFTLDGDYFDQASGKTRYINEVGELNLNQELVQITQDSSWTGKVWENVKGLFTGETTTTDTASHEAFNPMNFMDQQILGFYVYLTENIMNAYMSVIWFIFLGGAMAGSAYYAYKRFLEKNSKELPSIKGSGKIYALTVLGGFLFFTAPIISSSVDTEGAVKKAIYATNGDDSGNMYGYSTLAQQSVRYAAQLGTYFGNVESDYAMKAFLALIQFKQGMLEDPKAAIGAMEDRIRMLEAKIFEASFSANYVENVCKPYFNGYDMSKVTPEQARQMAITSKGESADAVLSNVGIHADRLAIDNCAAHSKKMSELSSFIIATKKAVNAELNTYEDMYDSTSSMWGGSSSEQDTFWNFMQLMIWTQNNFGWMASITPHSSYLFFKNINVFEYNSGLFDPDEGDQSKTFSNGAENSLEQEGQQKSDFNFPATQLVEGISGVLIGVTVNNAMWFIVPGFDTVNTFFVNNLTALTFKGQTGKLTGMAERLNLMKEAVIGVVGKIPFIGTLFGGISDFITKIMGIDTYMQFQLLIMFLSFFLAMWVVTTMISTVTVLSVTIFLTFKIVMYYVELIIFFMSAPIVGIYTTIMSAEPKQYMKTYFSNLAMLIVTPMLIVTASYIVLPISEFFRGLFNALVTLIFKVFEKGADDLNQDVVGTNIIDTLTKQTAMASMQGVAEIFAMLSTIIISYIIIFNYKDWFTKLIGVDNVINNTKNAMGEMQAQTSKFIAPM